MKLIDKNTYKFTQPLVEGVIKYRRGQFVMFCSIDGEEKRCHCPCTGRIGDIDISDRPCLLSKSKNGKRTTEYTVEAISLNKVNDKNKNWIGINQTASNRYIEYFLRQNTMKDMINCLGQEILREQTLGDSKLDFLIGDTFIEIKTPMHYLDLKIPKYIQFVKHTTFGSTDRMMKHIKQLEKSLKSHQRAILLTTFTYGAPIFHIKEEWKSIKFIDVSKTVLNSINSGVEYWQANLIFNENCVRLDKYFKLKLY